MELQFSENIRPTASGVKAVGEYYAFSNREICHAIKAGDMLVFAIDSSSN